MPLSKKHDTRYKQRLAYAGHYAECHYAECHYAKCCYAVCPILIALLSAFMLNVVLLNVVKPLVNYNVVPGNTKGGSITVLLYSCWTGLESAV